MTTETPEEEATPVTNTLEEATTVVETPIEEEAVVETPEEEEAAAEAQKTVSQEEFNKIYFQMKQAERDLSALQDVAIAPPAPSPVEAIPTLEQFDYDEAEFNKAIIQQQVQAQVATALASQKQATDRAAQAAVQATITQGFNNKAAAFAATNPDYEKAISAAVGIHFPTHVQEVILQSEVGPQLDYALLSNPALLTSIQALSPTQAIMEMGRMEQALTTPVKKDKPVSQAPAPFDTGNGGGRSTEDFRYDEGMTMDEYYAKTMANK